VRAFQLYLPGHLLSRHFGILPSYLPRDRFLPSELVGPLVAQCHRSTTVHSYGPSGELERHYTFIHPPLPRFRRNSPWEIYPDLSSDPGLDVLLPTDYSMKTVSYLKVRNIQNWPYLFWMLIACDKTIVTDTFYGNKQCNEE
jgi:hypothetical protein